MRAFLLDIQNITVTAGLAFATGLAFHICGLPAPFLLGALFGVWIIGAAITPIQTRLGIARWLQVPVVLGLGTVIGSNFRPDVLAHIPNILLEFAVLIWISFW